MLICKECGGVFESSDARYHAHYVPYGDTEVDSGGWYTCPECGHDEVVPAETCEICGEWCEDGGVHGLTICNDCQKKAKEIRDKVCKLSEAYAEQLVSEFCSDNTTMYEYVREVLW